MANSDYDYVATLRKVRARMKRMMESEQDVEFQKRKRKTSGLVDRPFVPDPEYVRQEQMTPVDVWVREMMNIKRDLGSGYTTDTDDFEQFIKDLRG